MTAWNQLREAVLTAQQSRRIDSVAVEKYGMNSLVLMENAAIGCVNWLVSRFADRQPSTSILCGSGNNGGDGFAIARHLRLLGWSCNVFVACSKERMSEDAKANRAILELGEPDVVTQVANDSQLPGVDLLSSELVIDAMLGTGVTGPPRAPFSDWISQVNALPAVRVAIDVPTGVDPESGQAAGSAFRPDATLTFVAKKTAMVAEGAETQFGEIHVIPIGIPTALIQEALKWQTQPPNS